MMAKSWFRAAHSSAVATMLGGGEPEPPAGGALVPVPAAPDPGVVPPVGPGVWAPPAAVAPPGEPEVADDPPGADPAAPGSPPDAVALPPVAPVAPGVPPPGTADDGVDAAPDALPGPSAAAAGRLVGDALVLLFGAPSLHAVKAAATATAEAQRRIRASVVTSDTVGDPPGSVGIRMQLALGHRRYDLRTRALVMGALRPPDQLVDHGADILELEGPHGPMPLPVCVPAPDEAAVAGALSWGADMIRLLRPTKRSLGLCAAAGLAALIPSGAADDAAAAGLPPERIVIDTLLLDVTGDDCAVAATAVGVIQGARIVRTDDVRAARRICDVLAAVLEAG